METNAPGETTFDRIRNQGRSRHGYFPRLRPVRPQILREEGPSIRLHQQMTLCEEAVKLSCWLLSLLGSCWQCRMETNSDGDLHGCMTMGPRADMTPLRLLT